MHIHELEVFLGLADSLHFTRAARAANLSPSALSRAVRRMEEEVGAPLLVRDRRRVSITPAGEALRRYARSTLEGWEKLRDEVMEGERVLTGEVRLYCSVTAAYTVLTDLITTYRHAYPGVHLRVETGDAADAVTAVESGQADITVAARPDRLPSGLSFRPITRTPLVFVAPRDPCEAATLVAQRVVDWARVPMVLSSRGLSRQRVDTWFREAGIRPSLYAEVSGHEAILSLVGLGCGVGVVPKIVTERSPFRGRVRLLNVKPPLESYVVGLCARRRRLESPVVRAFWETAPETG